jgi:hypothetical protein
MTTTDSYTLQDQPDFRIDKDEIGIIVLPGVKESETTVVHRGAGCPKVSPIQVHAGYLRCSKCRVPLTQLAADHITHDLDAGYNERTNSFRV